MERIPIPGVPPPEIDDPLDIGTPSITKSGELFPVIEPSPLILILEEFPGLQVIVAIRKPATRPFKAWSGDTNVKCSRPSSPTVTVLATDLCRA
jgi:hypothetical protein